MVGMEQEEFLGFIKKEEDKKNCQEDLPVLLDEVDYPEEEMVPISAKTEIEKLKENLDSDLAVLNLEIENCSRCSRDGLTCPSHYKEKEKIEKAMKEIGEESDY
jgi:hypothetical protein